MPSDVVVTIPLAESGEQEDALNERIVDAGFAPQRPHAEDVKVWANGTTYAKGDLVREPGLEQVYRSTENANKENEPSEDTDYAHWQPASVQDYPLQSPNFITEGKTYTQRTREEIVGVPTDPAALIYPYEAAHAYRKGQYATEGGFGYEALTATTGEAPSTHPLAWKKLGPAIHLS